jgi:hypothetical protein
MMFYVRQSLMTKSLAMILNQQRLRMGILYRMATWKMEKSTSRPTSNSLSKLPVKKYRYVQTLLHVPLVKANTGVPNRPQLSTSKTVQSDPLPIDGITGINASGIIFHSIPHCLISN